MGNKKRIGVFWFTNDIRLHDNPALTRAQSFVDELLCVYIIDHPWQFSSQYILPKTSQLVDDFLQQSLTDLQLQLNALGQRLIVFRADTVRCISDQIEQVNATDVFRSETAGWYENRAWKLLQKRAADVRFHSIDSHTLFNKNELPFQIDQLPASFTQFKKAVSNSLVTEPMETLKSLPPPPISIDLQRNTRNTDSRPSNTRFIGGEQEGLAHLRSYFSSNRPSSYKQVRNAIDGWDNSCKLSPWLANGSLSVRKVVANLAAYEQKTAANESTYWIYFELLWREFFQWYAHKNGSKLFSLAGIKRISPLTGFYPERFQKWVNGLTPYPIVNACMNELRVTGYLSNRGRQIVASCLVNELSIDWRYGAAYFEQVLIDYDMASNWGNWQYIAGVGADVRNKRHFNLEKQTQQFDPEGRYIHRWGGDTNPQPLDSIDAADWPVT